MKYALFFVLFPYALWAGVYSNNDFQYWSTLSSSISIPKHSRLAVETQERFGGGASKLFYYHFQGNLFIVFNEHIEIGPGYRQIETLGLDEKTWGPIYSPLTDMNLTWVGSDGWKIVNRNRIQYLITPSQPSLWQYRTRFAFFAPFRIGKARFTPRIEEELFFRETFGYVENRFAVGWDMPFSKTINGTLLYMLRHITVAQKWKHQHTLWTRFEFSF